VTQRVVTDQSKKARVTRLRIISGKNAITRERMAISASYLVEIIIVGQNIIYD